MPIGKDTSLRRALCVVLCKREQLNDNATKNPHLADFSRREASSLQRPRYDLTAEVHDRFRRDQCDVFLLTRAQE